MITVYREFQINNGTAPYNYTFTSSNSCVTFDVASGVSTDGIVSTNVTYFDTGCIATSPEIYLSVQDFEGCNKTFTMDVTDPCTTFSVGSISETKSLSFTVPVTGGSGTGGYTYTWNWDNSLFMLKPNGSNGSNGTLDLTLIVSPHGNFNTTIYVQVTDALGCTKLKTYVYSFCQPRTLNAYVALSCLRPGNSHNDVLLNAEACNNVGINWSTLSVSLPPGLTYQHYYQTDPGAIPNLIKISGVSGLAPATYQGTFTVKNNHNTLSNVSTIFITVPNCIALSGSIFIPNFIFRPECDDVLVGASFVLRDLDDVIIHTNPIEWSSFHFIPSVGQSVNGDGDELTTPFGTVVLNNDHEIVYTIDDLTNAPGPDFFQFQVCDNLGNCSSTTDGVVILECFVGPSAVADSFCAICGEATSFYDILANDTIADGTIDIASVVIVTYPTNGSINLDSTGRVSYTSNVGYSGVDTFTYKVANTDGEYSNNAVVTIDVICAGEDTSVNSCN